MTAPSIPCEPLSTGRVGLVLAGGAARGAYEVGVVQHILEEVSRDLGREVPLDILCGTSVGALNACFLAGFADEPRGRATRLVNHWTGLTMRDVVHPDARMLYDTVRSLFGRPPSEREDGARRGGILDPAGIERVITRALDFSRIGENLRAGHVHAITLSTTHVGSGKTVVFAQRREPGLPRWGSDPTVEARAVEIRPEHALASAAIPFLFPAVRIDGQFYCDGGLRQNVPLSPARRLGADGLIVVSPRFIERRPTHTLEHQRELAFPGPLFLLGKALNALLLDRVENDIDRLERINRILLAGCKHYGPGFLDAINQELGSPPGELRTRPLKVVLIRASQDIGRLSAEFVRSPGFAKRVPGVLGRLMRRIAESSIEADLLSYLLFDGEFAAQLIELGRADARKRHAELCAFFEAVRRDQRAATG